MTQISDTDFSYVCTVTLTLEISLFVKVMLQPWVVDKFVWKIIQIQKGGKKLLPRQDLKRTDW